MDCLPIKNDMMKLWKDTFHDTDKYIKIVFDSYFSVENVFVRYEKEKLISALLCVPYDFHCSLSSDRKVSLTGMYLCGLATDPDFRGRGIMSQLMQEAESSLLRRGFDLTFLIPADGHLREYYHRKGYFDASFLSNEELRVCDLGPIDDQLKIFSIKEAIDTGQSEFIENLAKWCHDIEARDWNSIMVHSCADMVAVMRENENSIFLTDSTFDLKYPILAKVHAVVFPEVISSEERSVVIKGLYLRDRSFPLEQMKHELEQNPYKGNLSYDRIDKNEPEEYIGSPALPIGVVCALKKEFDHVPIKLQLPCRKNSNEDMDVIRYAMVKPLRKNEFFTNYHIPQFRISLMLD